MSEEWISYWDKYTGLYAMYHLIAEDYCERFHRLIQPDSKTRLLDFGCGLGLIARNLSSMVGVIKVYDPSPNMLEKARMTNRGIKNIEVLNNLDTNGLLYDLIIINSVVQYLKPEDLHDVLLQLFGHLDSEGSILITDIIPGKTSRFKEVFELARFAFRKKCPLIVARHLGVYLMSDYSKTEHSAPLVYYSMQDLDAVAKGAGYSLKLLDENIYYNRLRYTAILKKIAC